MGHCSTFEGSKRGCDLQSNWINKDYQGAITATLHSAHQLLRPLAGSDLDRIQQPSHRHSLQRMLRRRMDSDGRHMNGTSGSVEGHSHTKSPAGYIYEPLDRSGRQMRLLRILNEAPEGVVRISLEKHELEDAPPYVALSYIWGDLTDMLEFNAEGSALRVSKTLYTILLDIRKTRDSRLDFPFWIDPICIDQHNVFKRNHEVMMTASIYRSVMRVVSWLGNLHLTLDTLKDSKNMGADDASPILHTTLNRARACARTGNPLFPAQLVCFLR